MEVFINLLVFLINGVVKFQFCQKKKHQRLDARQLTEDIVHSVVTTEKDAEHKEAKKEAEPEPNFDSKKMGFSTCQRR